MGALLSDPLEAITTDLRSLFEQDPSCTGREFLEKIQGAYPGQYPVSYQRPWPVTRLGFP
jgi:hypothetical protein